MMFRCFPNIPEDAPIVSEDYEARNLWRRSQLDYRVALNFCGSLILRMGVFLCFAGTNFRDWEKLVLKLVLPGIHFCDFQEVVFYLELQCSRLLSTNNRIQVNNM